MRIVFTADTARLWTGLKTEEEEDGVSAGGRRNNSLKREHWTLPYVGKVLTICTPSEPQCSSRRLFFQLIQRQSCSSFSSTEKAGSFKQASVIVTFSLQLLHAFGQSVGFRMYRNR